MVRNDLSEHFNFFGENGKGINLYDKVRTGTYVGTIILKNGTAYIVNPTSIAKGYRTASELRDALAEIEKNLPWPVGTYDPSSRQKWNMARRLDHYLRSTLGMENTENNRDVSVYKKHIGANWEVSVAYTINIMDDNTPHLGTVDVKLNKYYLSDDFDTVEEAVEIIGSGLSSVVLSGMGDGLELLTKLDTTKVRQLDMWANNWATLSTDHFSFKDTMIDVLEKQLEKLRAL